MTAFLYKGVSFFPKYAITNLDSSIYFQRSLHDRFFEGGPIFFITHDTI
jgi:hypothetical protein